jgi:hypothetical protein
MSDDDTVQTVPKYVVSYADPSQKVSWLSRRYVLVSVIVMVSVGPNVIDDMIIFKSYLPLPNTSRMLARYKQILDDA